jgi:hypothetical protein
LVSLCLSLLVGRLGGLGVLLVLFVLSVADEGTAQAAGSRTDQGACGRIASPEGTADDRTGEGSQARPNDRSADSIAIVCRLATRAESARGNQKPANYPSFPEPHGSIPFDAGGPAKSRRGRSPSDFSRHRANSDLSGV